MIDSAKDRSLKKRRECRLTREDLWKQNLKQGGRCAYSGAPLNWRTNPEIAYERPSDRVSLDMVDSDGDYTVDNIQLVTDAVNKAKRDMPEGEFLAWCRSVAKYRNL